MIDFSNSCYKQIIRSCVELLREKHQITFLRVAEATDVQKTYLSKVLNNDGSHFSADQLFAICEFLGMVESEIGYCLKLLEFQTSSNQTRKKSLAKQIRQIQADQFDSKKFLKTVKKNDSAVDRSKYYLDANSTLAHMYLTIPKYRKDPELLKQKLKISSEQLEAVLDTLVGSGFFQRKGKQLEIGIADRHLASDDSLTLPHQKVMKLKSLERIDQVAVQDRYNLVVTFTANDLVNRKIKKRLLEVTQEIESLVKQSRSQGVYQLNIDLFPWA